MLIVITLIHFNTSSNFKFPETQLFLLSKSSILDIYKILYGVWNAI